MGKELGDFIEMMVSDTGTGISENRLDKIFDRFYQVDGSQKREHEGTGIGLALSKELVELHHGQITVESEAGKGTTFHIYLPAGKDHFEDKEIVEGQPEMLMEREGLPIDEISDVYVDICNQSLERKVDKPTILIVEDNLEMQTYISDRLKRYYKVLQTESGVKGLKVATENIPDLIISDVMMPGMDGFELCEKIKKNVHTSHIPMILLTARAELEDKIEGLQSGADDYIPKPFDTDELLARAENLIKQRKLLREKFSKEFLHHPDSIMFSGADQKFLQKAIKIINLNLPNYDYSVEDFSKEIAFSRFQLHRKIKALTNLSISGFVRSIRLKHAEQMLAVHSGNITETAYACGFNSLSYFSRCFKEVYGSSPAEYAANFDRKNNK